MNKNNEIIIKKLYNIIKKHPYIKKIIIFKIQFK